MIPSIAHIGLTISDLSRSITFYRDIMGFTYLGEMTMDGPESAALFQRLGCGARVAYLQPKDKSAPLVELIQFTDLPSTPAEPSLFQTSISELCFLTDDIDAEYQRLQALGVEFLSQPQTFDSTAYGFGKSRAVYLRDPDRNILELIQPLD